MVSKSLDDFLSSDEAARSITRASRCATCTREDVAAVVVEFLDKKAAGLTHVNAGFFLERYLGPNFKFKVGRSTFTRHIKRCLERDVITGKPFDPKRQPETVARIQKLKASS